VAAHLFLAVGIVGHHGLCLDLNVGAKEVAQHQHNKPKMQDNASHKSAAKVQIICV
jgi:hypothetical protein